MIKPSIIVGLATMLTACGANHSFNQKAGLWDQIFSTRPQNQTQSIFLFKLQNPSLLEEKNNSGRKDLSPELVARIQKEQEDFISQATKASSDVKVLYRYRLVLNAVTLLGPKEVLEKLKSVQGVSQVQSSGNFARPQPLDLKKLSETLQSVNLKTNNSVYFIHANKAHERGFTGRGLRVGIIDTGIDYTHAMLGGAGQAEIYKQTDPAKPSALFPNQKVVGGVDLVGTDFDSASAHFARRIPKPDDNPLDEGGHGSHVAGTVAGIGDDVNTYSGVAPEASLYAIKVFGASGSTSDEVVIAGLEYAANPSGDLNMKDHLDVINMSLGSSYGTPHIFYAEAIKNLSRAGTVVVASAGNSGAKTHIVGAPSVSEDAISVAASIDDSEHNWKFGAVRVQSDSGLNELTEAIESPIAKPLKEISALEEIFVYAGTAQNDFSEDLKKQIQGHVALIDRGVVTFAEKMKKAEAAGAVAVVVVNNQDGGAFAMGGDGHVSIPALMIPKALGLKIKEAMKTNTVKINFKVDDKIEKPNLIDNLTDFSSEGPRSYDSLIKPEISAPGLNIISAEMGGGQAAASMSGTSMAGPHIAGVMALLKQAHPELSSAELKSLLMGTAISIRDEDKQIYPISRQGSGRVQVDKAIQSTLVSSPVSLSLGDVQVDQSKALARGLTLKNISQNDLNLTYKFEGSAALKLSGAAVTVKALSSVDLNLAFKIVSQNLSAGVNQAGGWVKFYLGADEVFRVPVLAMVRLISHVQAESLSVQSSSSDDSFQSPAVLKLKNLAKQDGQVLLFNSLGLDSRKKSANTEPTFSKECDLQAAGYRIKDGILSVAVKTFSPVSTWNNCEISVQIDSDGDGQADQELVGVATDHIEGLNGDDFKSYLLDATVARELRKDHEQKVMTDPKHKVDYTSAVVAAQPMTAFDHTTVAVVQVSLSDLKLKSEGTISLKIATTNTEDYASEADDYLGVHDKQWLILDPSAAAQAYLDLPESLMVKALETSLVTLTKGYGQSDLLVLIPTNKTTAGSLLTDDQSVLVSPQYVGAED